MVRNALKMQEINEKKAFSQRLKKQLLEQNWPVNSPTWLAREFNIRYNGHSIRVCPHLALHQINMQAM
jgi:hypothetical protein